MKFESQIKFALNNIITNYCDKSNEKVMIKLGKIYAELKFNTDNSKEVKKNG